MKLEELLSNIVCFAITINQQAKLASSIGKATKLCHGQTENFQISLSNGFRFVFKIYGKTMFVLSPVSRGPPGLISPFPNKVEEPKCT